MNTISRRLCSGLGFLLSLVGGSAFAEAECYPTAVVAGPAEAQELVTTRLSERGVWDVPAPGCPAIRAELGVTPEGFRVLLQDPSGKVGEFYVTESDNAARAPIHRIPQGRARDASQRRRRVGRLSSAEPQNTHKQTGQHGLHP